MKSPPGEQDEDGSPPTAVYFDPDGDTRLLVTADGVENVFIVSSKIMTRVCDAWNRMLSPGGYFTESQPGPDGMKEVSLPDDDGDALSILLNIAHLNFEKVPDGLKFRKLLAVSVLTDKYGATKLVRPWVKAWVGQQIHKLEAFGHEEWLWMAWEFGLQCHFDTLVAMLTRNARLENGRCCILHSSGCKKFLSPQKENDFYPPDILASIMSVRKKTIDRMLGLCYTYVEVYEERCRPPFSSSSPYHYTGVCGKLRADTDERRKCDSFTLGSLITSLGLAGLGAQRTSNHVGCSINELYSRLKNLRIFTYEEGYRVHDRCNFETELLSALAKIVENIPSAVLNVHRRHIERQKNILMR